MNNILAMEQAPPKPRPDSGKKQQPPKPIPKPVPKPTKK